MLTSDVPDSTPGLQPFAREQMVACDECLRTNPPTRVNCMYCGALLPLNETTTNLQKPTLRRLEKWELGYNNLLVPPANPVANPPESELAEAANHCVNGAPSREAIRKRMGAPLTDHPRFAFSDRRHPPGEFIGASDPYRMVFSRDVTISIVGESIRISLLCTDERCFAGFPI